MSPTGRFSLAFTTAKASATIMNAHGQCKGSARRSTDVRILKGPNRGQLVAAMSPLGIHPTHGAVDGEGCNLKRRARAMQGQCKGRCKASARPAEGQRKGSASGDHGLECKGNMVEELSPMGRFFLAFATRGRSSCERVWNTCPCSAIPWKHGRRHHLHRSRHVLTESIFLD